MELTIRDLKKLGFKKTKVSAEESGGLPFHYYTLEIGNDYDKLCLISKAIEKNEPIVVEIFDYNSFKFTETTELILFVNILQNNYERSIKK